MLSRLQKLVQGFRTGKRDAAKSIVRKRKILERVIALLPVASVTLVLIGYIYLLAIPWSGLGRQTYMSENAIQPAQVNTYWSWGEVHTCDRFAEDLVLWDSLKPQARAEKVKAVFAKHGLRAETQAYQFRLGPTANETISGVNVHAVMRAAKTEGAESIVLSASWRSRDAGRLNVRGIATMLTLSKYLSKLSVWSKDIVFVISDGHLDGMQAWITEWHGQEQSNLDAAPIRQRSGPIWAALNLDYPHHSFSHLGVFFEAANGLLPNLDFINTAIHVSRWAGGSQVRLHADDQDLREDKWHGSLLDARVVKEYERAAMNVLSQVRRQATGSTSGPEGVFAKYRIDALTLFAVPADGPHGFHAVGKTIESTLRSLNNLLERFHQSFFLYLLSSPDTFISLANYLAAPLLVSVGLTLYGLSIWTRLYMAQASRPIASAWTLAAATHLQGAALYYGWTRLPMHVATQPTTIATLAVLPPTMAWLLAQLAHADAHLATTLHCFNLLLSGVALAVVSVLNFSLGVFTSISLGIPLLVTRRAPWYVSAGLATLTTPACVALWTRAELETLVREHQLLGTWFLPFSLTVVTPLLAQSILVSLL